MQKPQSHGRPLCSLHGVELTESGECEDCSQLMTPVAVAVFEDGDDQGYRAWVARHRGGYVINIAKSFNLSEAVLHQASCVTINDEPASGSVFVGDYVKVCGLRRAELDEWSVRELGALVPPCQLCF